MGKVKSRIKGPKRKWLKSFLWSFSQKCFICEKQLPCVKRATLEHVIPLSKGGADNVTNIRLVHWKCNNEKCDTVDKALLEKLRETNALMAQEKREQVVIFCQ